MDGKDAIKLVGERAVSRLKTKIGYSEEYRDRAEKNDWRGTILFCEYEWLESYLIMKEAEKQGAVSPEVVSELEGKIESLARYDMETGRGNDVSAALLDYVSKKNTEEN
jgi:hypothetical protein